MAKKKTRSAKPAVARMLQRAAASCDLPPEQQAAFYYGAGREPDAFCAAVAAGEPAAVSHALDVLSAAHWLRPRDMARYGSRMRAALYAALASGNLQDAAKRLFYDVECRMLETLLIRARHSEPGPAQQRAQRRLLAEQELVRRHFGDCPDSVPYKSWPAVAAPVKLLRRAVRNGWFTAQQAAEMEAGEESILMRLIHGAAEELPAFSALSSAAQPAAALCYFFCEQKRDVCRWLVAPFAELSDLCGVILAADGSFCYVTDDWGDIYGCV